jgi:hypothetical protein
VSHHIRVVGPTRVSLELFDYESTDEAETKVSPGMKWADLKFIYGWDQPLQTFFLQVHDAFVADPDANPVIWFGATKDKVLYEVEDLVRVAQLYGLRLDQEMQTKLYGEKDDGV